MKAKEIVGWGLGVIAGLAVVFGILFALQGTDFFLYRFFAPRYEGVRRQVFEETKSYNQGMIQELQNMQFEYQKASPSQKTTLRKIILHRTADFPEERLPEDLRQFIDQLKKEEVQ